MVVIASAARQTSGLKNMGTNWGQIPIIQTPVVGIGSIILPTGADMHKLLDQNRAEDIDLCRRLGAAAAG